MVNSLELEEMQRLLAPKRVKDDDVSMMAREVARLGLVIEGLKARLDKLEKAAHSRGDEARNPRGRGVKSRVGIPRNS